MKKLFIFVLLLFMAVFATLSSSPLHATEDSWALEFTRASSTTWTSGTEVDVRDFYMYFYDEGYFDFYAEFYCKSTVNNANPDFQLKIKFTDGTSVWLLAHGLTETWNLNGSAVTGRNTKYIANNQANFYGNTATTSYPSEVYFSGVLSIPNQGKVPETILIVPLANSTTSYFSLKMRWLHDPVFH
jgi:hypothetical protein